MTGAAAQFPRPGPARRRRRKEDGSAMLLVVGALFVMAVIAANLVGLSEVAADEARVSAERSRLRHVAESAADRAFWLIIADRRQYGNRTLGQGDAARPDATTDAWMADGTPHELAVDDHPARVEIRDAAAGLDLSDTTGRTLRTALATGDADADADLDAFLDVYRDYADSDDNRRLHGFEKDDYAAAGWPDMPRNGRLQFREEFFWLNGAGDALARFAETATTAGLSAAAAQDADAAAATPPSVDALRIIPPDGISFPQTQLSNFFSATPEVIRQAASLTPDELAAVLEARRRSLTEGLPLDQLLDLPLLQRLRQRLSFQESGIATFVVTAFSEDGDIRREVRCTRDLRDMQGWNYGTHTLVIWEEFSP